MKKIIVLKISLSLILFIDSSNIFSDASLFAPHQQYHPTVTSAVTYNFSGGRFGDNLVACIHALWISYKYGIPFLYKPFPYSDQLALHEIATALDEGRIKNFQRHVTLTQQSPLVFQSNSSTLYTIPYFPECRLEHQRPNDYVYFEVNWEDENFRNVLRNLIKPRFAIKKVALPCDKVTVAVHVRKATPQLDDPVLFEQPSPTPTSNGGYADLWWPFKFATDEYYQAQIKGISALFDHQPLYVYLFTDYSNPVALVEAYKEAIQLPNIEFDCRKTENNHYSNVLEDFFSLPLFDCLVRVESNFSFVASKLARYKMAVTPKHYYLHPTKGFPVIDQVAFTISNNSNSPTLSLGSQCKETK